MILINIRKMINKSKKKNDYSFMTNKNQNKAMMIMKKMMAKTMIIVMIINLQIKISNLTNKSRKNQYRYLIKDIAKITE